MRENRRAHIWHDASGKIVAVGYAPEGKNHDIQAVPLAAQDHTVLEIDLSEHVLETVHLTHYIDVEKRCLVERTASE